MAKIKIDINSGKIVKSNIVVGIDLGTTNSLVAWINPQTNKAEVIVDEWGALLPSVILIKPNADPVVGILAKESLLDAPERTIFSVKRLLGRSFQEITSAQQFLGYNIVEDEINSMLRIEIDKKLYNAVELSAMILRALKHKAEKVLGQEVFQAVISVPAYFNDSQRQATRDAGKLAGLDVLRIINEPTAASLSYGLGLDRSVSQTILVYDLGGGTFDISILQIEDGVFEVLATQGDTRLGGDDIDYSIMAFWQETHPALANCDQPGDIQALRLLAETAKIFLSNNTNLIFTEWFEFPNKSTVQPQGIESATKEKIELSLNYGDLVNAAQVLVLKTQACIVAALRDASLKPSDIQALVLVGGSSRYPEISRVLSAQFPHLIINNSLNPDEVVALGAAIEADVLAGNRKDILLLDITPLGLGIETAGGLMDLLIPRNTKLPCRVRREYSTSVDGQINLQIAVFQGERAMVKENRKLGEFILKGIPAMPAGFPKIEVIFSVNADGVLTVYASELRSGVSQNIEIKPQYGLSDEALEKMLLDGFANAQSDMQVRGLQETINEAQQLIYSVNRFIAKNGDMLSPIQLVDTTQRIDALKRLLNIGSNKDALLQGITALNNHTRPFAENLMNIAISSALKGKEI